MTLNSTQDHIVLTMVHWESEEEWEFIPLSKKVGKNVFVATWHFPINLLENSSFQHVIDGEPFEYVQIREARMYFETLFSLPGVRIFHVSQERTYLNLTVFYCSISCSCNR